MVLILIRGDFPLLHHSLMQHTSLAYSGPAPELQWDQQLQFSETWHPAPGPLLVLGSHPRDEILGAGGLIHTWVSMGHDVTVLSVTDGEADDTEVEHLDLLRRDELRTALRKLCATHVSVVRLGMRYGHVAQAQNRLRLALEALIEPHMTLVAPFEHDGNPDRDAVGRVCRELAGASGVSLARYLIGSWQSHPAMLGNGDLNWGKFQLDMEARRAKIHALQCFTAQRPSQAALRVDPFHRSFEAFLL
jgi:LmbE family N-acetylglucosaminyl deacetylase